MTPSPNRVSFERIPVVAEFTGEAGDTSTRLADLQCSTRSLYPRPWTLSGVIHGRADRALTCLATPLRARLYPSCAAAEEFSATRRPASITD